MGGTSTASSGMLTATTTSVVNAGQIMVIMDIPKDIRELCCEVVMNEGPLHRLGRHLDRFLGLIDCDRQLVCWRVPWELPKSFVGCAAGRPAGRRSCAWKLGAVVRFVMSVLRKLGERADALALKTCDTGHTTRQQRDEIASEQGRSHAWEACGPAAT